MLSFDWCEVGGVAECQDAEGGDGGEVGGRSGRDMSHLD
jgi:hypothetical protein